MLSEKCQRLKLNARHDFNQHKSCYAVESLQLKNCFSIQPELTTTYNLTLYFHTKA